MTNKKKTWFSKEITKCMKRKNMLYRKYLRNRTEYRFDTYNLCINTVNSMIIHAKREYYNMKFEYENNNMRVTWTVIYDVLNKRRTTKNEIISIQHDGENVMDKYNIANFFNEYFVSIGLKLQNKVYHCRAGHDQGQGVNQLFKDNFVSSMFFSHQ